MNLVEVYRAYREDSEVGYLARRLLEQAHWYAGIAEFDPKTGCALPLAFDEVLYRLCNLPVTSEIHDRLWRIVDHCRLSLEHILTSLSENPRREQAYMPIRDVKELNASSFIALSRRPGRNIREKLAGRPYMQAARRFQSVDLPQNRLVKAFVMRLADLLELRKEYLDLEDPLLGDIRRWLRTEDARAIGRWDNPPPNNTLLSHRDYRRVWDSWRWLQVLDDAIAIDLGALEDRAATVRTWDAFGKAYSEGQTLFGDFPVLFDYDTFEIAPWTKPIVRDGSTENRPDRDREPLSAPACVDLTYVRPRYACGSQVVAITKEPYLWQRWTGESGSADLELFNADIAVLHPDATTLSCCDLFFARDLDIQLIDRAANSFVRRLSKTFTDRALIWLAPDFVNDFQLEIVRRNLNARFAQAGPLPRSVAAVFEQVDYSKITGEGFQVVVVDSAGGRTYATKLVAKHDEALEGRVPETKGFYWERSPHVALGQEEMYDPMTEVRRIDAEGLWSDPVSLPTLVDFDENALRTNPDISDFDLVIPVLGSPVRGGLRLRELQRSAGDIPLWRDHIPELSIKVIKDGRYQPFFLVDRDTTIRPVRGVAVSIPVRDLFTLPADKPYYQFPLFQGQDPDDLGYVARLESPAFPLAANVTCRLTMTYSYGADDPYCLLFEPLDGSFKPVQVKWRPKDESIITNAPTPVYPTPLTWAELQRQYYAKKKRWTDYLDWVIQGTTRLVDDAENPTETRHLPTSGRIAYPWRTDKNGTRFAHIRNVSLNGRSIGDVFLHESQLCHGLKWEALQKDDLVYFDVQAGTDGRHQARDVSILPTITKRKSSIDVARIRAGLYVPFIKTWADARSLEDQSCPEAFRGSMGSLAQRLERLMQASTSPVQSEIRFLFCCMHRDMPSSVIQSLLAEASDIDLDERAERSCAFALGDLSQDWQYELFVTIWNRGDTHMLTILAQAIWRTESIVRVFDELTLAWLCGLLVSAMSEVNDVKQPTRSDLKRLTHYCELLLGLLRSRDSEVPGVRLALQPHQKMTKDFAYQVEAAATLVERSGLEIRSRVELADLPEKPEGDTTPDLLYALRLYLTGDVGAHAIRVAGVNDGDVNDGEDG